MGDVGLSDVPREGDAAHNVRRSLALRCSLIDDLPYTALGMTRIRRCLLVWAAAVAVAGLLTAQSPEWFQSHDLGNRWEGYFGQDQGNPDWELRSFVGSVDSYPMNANANLKIRYYVADTTEAFIRAQVVDRTVSYVMKPKPRVLSKDPGWREFSGWSTKDVLLDKGIASKDLGVLIRLGADNEGINRFAPAVVYSSASPAPVKTYRFDFFTAQGLRPFSFDVFGANGYHRVYSHLSRTPDRGTLHIEIDATDIPAGWTRVVLSPKYESGDSLNQEWKFYNERLP